MAPSKYPYRVVRYDVDSRGYAMPRNPVPYNDLSEAKAFYWIVQDAIDKWSDNSLVALYNAKGRAISMQRGKWTKWTK